MDVDRERGDGAEAAATAAAQRPEQVGVVGRVDRTGRAVGGDDVDRPYGVAGESPRPTEHADPAAERESGDADARARPTGNAHSLGGQGGVDVDESGTGADPSGVARSSPRVTPASDDTSMTRPGLVDQPG